MKCMKTETKTCRRCKKELPLNSFNKCKKNPDGLDYWCRECQKQYHIENTERIKKRQKEYYQEHKKEIANYRAEHREERLDNLRKWRTSNKEHEKAYGEKYRKEHKNEIDAYNKQYYSKNIDKERIRKKDYANTLIGWTKSIYKHCISADKKASRIGGVLPNDYIDEEWIMNEIQKGCTYKDKCGTTDWRLIGLNRKNNSLPHTKENCEPCCWKCNHDLAKHIHSKKVCLIKDSTLVNEYQSIREATRELKCSYNTIIECCSNKNKLYNGYNFMYKSDYEKMLEKEFES